MTADDMLKVKNAIIAFNKSKTWDEFLVKLDLIGIALNELESRYIEIMSMVDNSFLRKILENLKGNDSSISLKILFNRYTTEINRYTTEKFNGLTPMRIALPANIEYDNSSLSPSMKIYCDNDRYIAFNPDICDDMQALHGFDLAAEMANTVIYELAMENNKT